MSTNTWSGRRVLVTGAAGFIGSRLVRMLVDHGATVLCFDCNHGPDTALSLAVDPKDVLIISGRVEDEVALRDAMLGHDVDTVFHLAAQTLVGRALRDPIETYESNIRGTYLLLEACRVYSNSAPRIVVASSDKAYGDCETLPYTEDIPLAGRYPYDVSKSCADLLAQSYAITNGLPVAVTRCGNVYGPGDLHWSRIIPGTIRSLLRGERPVIRSDGSPVRDYVYVDDAVRGYLAVAEWLDQADGSADRPMAFNFSAGAPMSVIEVVRRVRMAVGREDLEPIIANSARGEIAAQHVDSSLARRLLSWKPKHGLEGSLARTVAWYRDYLNGDPARPAPATSESAHSAPAEHGDRA